VVDLRGPLAFRGPPMPIVCDVPGPMALAVDAMNVYWLSGLHWTPELRDDWSVMKAPPSEHRRVVAEVEGVSIAGVRRR
jgi:hypothetical protein